MGCHLHINQTEFAWHNFCVFCWIADKRYRYCIWFAESDELFPTMEQYSHTCTVCHHLFLRSYCCELSCTKVYAQIIGRCLVDIENQWRVSDVRLVCQHGSSLLAVDLRSCHRTGELRLDILKATRTVASPLVVVLCNWLGSKAHCPTNCHTCSLGKSLLHTLRVLFCN